MAGERMNLTGYTEISAVCTHPDFSGRGYARRLMLRLAAHISGRGDVPILHVDEDNERAISVYQRSGFEVRQPIRHWLVKRS